MFGILGQTYFKSIVLRVIYVVVAVARDVSGDNLAESGGEESEEEWNYIPGKDTQSSAQAVSKVIISVAA